MYTAKVRLNMRDAHVPFPINPSEDCTLESDACNGQSCLIELRNIYSFNGRFKKLTGFNHLGIDWSPCGHPPLDKFGRPHYNIHVFYVTPKDRMNAFCKMANPFICSPLDEQTYPNGRKFYVWGTDPDGAIANIPDSFTPGLDTAVPGEAVHAWDQAGAEDVADWFDPLLIMGLYDGKYYTI